MRPVIAIALAATLLGGCATIRQGLGAYQRAADKGINLGNGTPPDGPAAPPAASKDALPAGLGGDKEHAAYTSPPQR